MTTKTYYEWFKSLDDRELEKDYNEQKFDDGAGERAPTDSKLNKLKEHFTY